MTVSGTGFSFIVKTILISSSTMRKSYCCKASYQDQQYQFFIIVSAFLLFRMIVITYLK